MKWYTLAAEQGNASAQTYLGLMYATGQGVPQDYVRAHMWFNLSASTGDEDAIKGRDIFAKRMTSADISAAHSRASYSFLTGPVLMCTENWPNYSEDSHLVLTHTSARKRCAGP